MSYYDDMVDWIGSVLGRPARPPVGYVSTSPVISERSAAPSKLIHGDIGMIIAPPSGSNIAMPPMGMRGRRTLDMVRG